MSALGNLQNKNRFGESTELELCILMAGTLCDPETAAKQLCALQDTNARLINAAAGRGMVSEMDNMQEVAVLVCGLHDKIEQCEKDIKAIESNYDALQSPMPCGHLARYAVNEKEGTQYCAVCNGDALFEAGKKALEYINKMNKFARACIRYAGNSGDTYLADKAREALGENNHE